MEEEKKPTNADSKSDSALAPEEATNARPDAYEVLEQVGTWLDGLRAWCLRSWRLGILMAKGGYIVNERKRLFRKLGESVYYKISKGEIALMDLEPLVQQLDRLTKKVEIEEILIRSIRFGTKTGRSAKQSEKES